MKTPEFYLDEAVKAKSEFSKDFKDLMNKYKAGDCVRVFVESVIEEAMLRHSKEACEEQRQICADNATLLWDDDYLFPNARIDKQTIINAPTPKF